MLSTADFPQPLPGETPMAYETFLAYLSLPQPSLAETYRVAFGRQEGGVRSSSIYRWSARFNWKRRRIEFIQSRIAALIEARFSMNLALMSGLDPVESKEIHNDSAN